MFIRVDIDEKLITEAKEIFKQKSLGAEDYHIAKSLFLQKIRDKLLKQIQSDVTLSPVGNLLLNDEDLWELLMNSIDGKSTHCTLFINTSSEKVIATLIDNGEGFSRFFEKNPQIKALHADSGSGFVPYENIDSFTSDKAEQKSKVITAGGRGKALARISYFLKGTPDGQVWIANIGDLKKNLSFQKLIGISPEEIERLPAAGAVIVMVSPVFSLAFGKKYISEHKGDEVGSLSANYILKITQNDSGLMKILSPTLGDVPSMLDGGSVVDGEDDLLKLPAGLFNDSKQESPKKNRDGSPRKIRSWLNNDRFFESSSALTIDITPFKGDQRGFKLISSDSESDSKIDLSSSKLLSPLLSKDKSEIEELKNIKKNLERQCFCFRRSARHQEIRYLQNVIDAYDSLSVSLQLKECVLSVEKPKSYQSFTQKTLQLIDTIIQQNSNERNLEIA